jgi:hypothetical protein
MNKIFEKSIVRMHILTKVGFVTNPISTAHGTIHLRLNFLLKELVENLGNNVSHFRPYADV